MMFFLNDKIDSLLLFSVSERSLTDSPKELMTPRSFRNSISSSPDSDRSYPSQSSGKPSNHQTIAPAPFSNLQLTRNWVEEHGCYAVPEARSPGHSSSDSGFVASPSTQLVSEGSRSNSRTPEGSTREEFPEPPDCILFPEGEYVDVADDSDVEGDRATLTDQRQNNRKPSASNPTTKAVTASRNRKPSQSSTNGAPTSNNVASIVSQLSKLATTKPESGTKVLKCTPHAGEGIRRAVEQLQRANAQANAKGKQPIDLKQEAGFDVEEGDEQLLVVCDFAATGQTQMSVKKGDVVIGNVDQAGEQRGWLWAMSLRSGETGFIPAAYTQPCRTDIRRGDLTTRL